MTRRARRGLAIAVVLGAGALAALAAAAGAEDVAVAPRIVVVRHAAGSGGSGVVTLTNHGTQPFQIGSITYDCGAAPALRLLGGSGEMPFTLAAGGGTRTVVLECPGDLSPGMHRCAFTVRDAAAEPVVDFLGACATEGMPLLATSRPSLAFGSVEVGEQAAPQTVTISNASTTAPVEVLQLQVDDDNFVVGSPCQDTSGCDAGSIPPLGALPIEVSCRPTATGPLAGELHVVGANGFALTAPIALACDGGAPAGPVLTLTPSSIAIPTPVEVVGGTAPAMIQLRNAGSGALDITAVSIADDGVTGAAADWSRTLSGQCTALPCRLAGGQTLDVELTFDPGALAARPARLIVSYSDPAARQASAGLSGTGRGATLELASPETTLDFGVVAVGAPATRTFALKNLGNRPTTASFEVTPGAPFELPASVVVEPGTIPAVTVTCQASQPVLAQEILTVTAGSDAITPPISLALRCDVRDTPIAASPTAHAFGEIRRGAAPVAQAFAIERTGSGAPIPLQPLAPSANPNTSIGALTAMQTPASFTVTIDPLEDGPLDEAVVVAADGSDPIEIPITGQVVSPGFTTPATPVSLGTFCVGQPTTPTTIALVSIGTGRFELAAPALAAARSPFTLEPLAPATYPAQLDPGARATVLVTPRRGTTADQLSDQLLWTTDAGNAATTLGVEFVADGGAVAPDRLAFGDVQIRLATAPPQVIQLQNCDTVPLELEPLEVPPPFALVDQFPTRLEPAQKATFQIAFRPTQVGPVEEQLELRSTAGDRFVVTLTGNGVTGDGTEPDDEAPPATGCGCRARAGGADALALVLVASTLLRRRRRR